MKNKFSNKWKSSKNQRKQRKYQRNAPLHTKSKFLAAHLSKELRQKHNARNAIIRKGDKVKIARGNFKGKTGKIERADIKNTRVFITGIEIIKKDGTKTLRAMHPSNLKITELNLNDKKRFKRESKRK